MSAPLKSSIVSEIISGISSLNMNPDISILNNNEYISDQLGQVSHAIEHFNAAIAVLNERSEEFHNIVNYVYRNNKDIDVDEPMRMLSHFEHRLH